MESVHIESLSVGAFETNCHILHRAGYHDALVIDPGSEPERIIRHLRDGGLRVCAYLITHGHMDHVAALADVCEQFPAPVAMNPVDRAWAFTPTNSWPPWYDTPRLPATDIRDLAEGQTWTDANLAYSIIETPGHSPGSVSFHFPAEKLLFSGDVLFQGGVGRTDLPGGHGPTLLKSIHRLMQLPDDTRVYTGHGSPTTIGHERKTNPFLKFTSWAE